MEYFTCLLVREFTRWLFFSSIFFSFLTNYNDKLDYCIPFLGGLVYSSSPNCCPSNPSTDLLLN